MSESSPYSQTLVCIIFKCNGSWTPELFQRAIYEAQQNHNTICQWHGTTLERPHRLHWYTAFDLSLSAAPVDELRDSIRALAAEEPVALTFNMLRSFSRIMRAPVTLTVVIDMPDGKSISFVEQQIHRAAEMQRGAKGFHAWTQGFDKDGQHLLYLGGWDSKELHLELGASDREEDKELVEVAEETISLFSSMQMMHVQFKDEPSKDKADKLQLL